MADGCGSADTGVTRRIQVRFGFQVTGRDGELTLGAERRDIGDEISPILPAPASKSKASVRVFFYACQFEMLIVQCATLGRLGSSVGRAED